jgi:CHASE3 domain sensor protein
MPYILEDEKMTEMRTTIRLTDDEAEFIRRRASELGTSMVKVMREAIDEYRNEECKELRKLVQQIGIKKLLKEVRKNE